MSDQKMIQPSDPPKSPALALILNLLGLLWLNGIGNMFLGQIVKGIVLLGVGIVALVLAGVSMLCCIGYVLFPLLWLAFPIVLALDAYLLAKKMEDGEAIGEWQFFFQKGATPKDGDDEEGDEEGDGDGDGE